MPKSPFKTKVRARSVSALRKASRVRKPNRKLRELLRSKPIWETSAETENMKLVQQPGAKPSNPKDALGILKAPSSTVSAVVRGELGVAMLEGALKYGRHNYRAIGVRASVYYDAANRHLDAWWEGEDLDPDSSDDPELRLHHITKAIAGLCVLRDAMIQNKFVDDRPPRTAVGWQKALDKRVKALLAKYPNPVLPYVEGDERMK